MAETSDGISRLQGLTREKAGNWVELGRALKDLEAISRVSPSGRAWPDVLRDYVEGLGMPVSSGHLRKIQRAYEFLKTHAPSELSMDNMNRAKISAVEVAERLYKIDPEQGVQALADALGPSRVTFLELQRRYDQVLKAKPEARSPRQIGWDVRRGAERAERSAVHPAPAKAGPVPLAAVVQDQGPSFDLKAEAEALLRRAWSEGRQEGERQASNEAELRRFRDLIADRDREIAALEKELMNLRVQVEDLSDQNEILAGKLKDRGRQ